MAHDLARPHAERGLWAIWLSADMTIVELAALMGGLKKAGYWLGAHDMGGGSFAIVPLGDAVQFAPTAEQLADIIENFHGPLPMLRLHKDRE